MPVDSATAYVRNVIASDAHVRNGGLLAAVGRGVPESEAVREHVEDDCGAAPAGWLGNQERGRFS